MICHYIKKKISLASEIFSESVGFSSCFVIKNTYANIVVEKWVLLKFFFPEKLFHSTLF